MNKKLIAMLCSFGLAATSLAAFADVLTKIRDSGVIAMGYRVASVPFSHLEAGATTPVGYSIELCTAIAAAVGEEVGRSDLKTEWIAVDPSNRFQKIEDGSIVVECGSTTDTLERQRQVDFSYTTYLTGTRLLVRKGENLNRLQDLSGKVVAVTNATTNEAAVKRAAERLGIDLELLHVSEHSEGLAKVRADAADAYATDDVLLFGLIHQAEDGERYEVVGDFLSYEPYALPVPRDDSAFRHVVNRTLARLFKTGEIAHIHGRWFDPMSAPMPELLRAAFIVNGIPE